MPSTPPQVSFDNGQLTIVAPNSTMGDILRAVRTETGAEIDISGNANERVMSRFGPGKPRDVLAQLLNGSNFNYVMLGSPADAGKVEHLILTPKGASDQPAEQAQAQVPGQAQAATGSETNPFPRIQPPPQQAQDMTEDEAEDSTDAQDDQNAAPDAGQAAGQADGQAPNQPAIKTPEQLLQELQRQQQTQQQQQQGGTPGAGPTQPNQK
jgi:hypothetical protein